MVQTYSRGNDFATTKIFDEKFWINPTPEEIILQPYKIFDQKISDEKCCFIPIPVEFILQP